MSAIIGSGWWSTVLVISETSTSCEVAALPMSAAALKLQAVGEFTTSYCFKSPPSSLHPYLVDMLRVDHFDED